MKSKIKEIIKLRSNLNNLLDSITLQDFFEDYLDCDKPLLILILAYTPTFNDGDICENTVETYIGANDIAEMASCGIDILDKNDLTEELLEVSSLFEPEPEGLGLEIVGVLEDVLVKEHGTNWSMLIKCHKGNFEWEITPYNCGY